MLTNPPIMISRGHGPRLRSRAGLGPGVFLFLSFLLGVCACQDQSSFSPVIAKVAGYQITREEFGVQASFMGLSSDVKQLTPEMRRAILDTLLLRHLILSEARERKIRLEVEELDREERTLRGGMSEEAFMRSLSAQGLEYSHWRKVLADDLLTRKTLDLILTAKSMVNADEVRTYYQKHLEEFRHPAQIKALHVVLPSLKLAKQLRQRVTAGEDIASVAASFGVSLDNFGEPAWLSQGHMPEDLEKKVFALKPGALAGPYKSSYGYHVLRVLEKRPAGVVGLTQAAPVIQRRLSELKKQELAQVWIGELRKTKEVWLDPAFLAEGEQIKSGSN